MVTVVVIINILISLILFYVAWRIWQLRLTLSQVADNLLIYERNTHNVLHGAPEAILTSQQNIHNLRQGKNKSPQLQIQRLRQIVRLLTMAAKIWRSYFPILPRGTLLPLRRAKIRKKI